MVNMADKVGEMFPDLLLSVYVVPTLGLHTTLASAYSRTTTTPHRLSFDYTPSKPQIDFCLLGALALIYIVRKVVVKSKPKWSISKKHLSKLGQRTSKKELKSNLRWP